MLEVNGITGSYNGRKVIDDLSFSVKKGEIFGVLGPNGSGKTTLMKMLTGIHPLDTGSVSLSGRDLGDYGSKQLAQTIAVLPQFIDEFFTYTVKEVVSMGRYPYQKGLFKQLTTEDEKAVERAMKQTGVMDFAEQSIHSLSGGEKQRVYLAQALSQEPQLLFLDEPTNHLDISHQKNLLDGLKKWAKEEELTVVAIFHDLNLAGLYCDRLLLLQEGRAAAIRRPKEMLTEEMVFDVYGTKVKRLLHPELPRPLMTMSPEKLDYETERIDVGDLIYEQTDEMIKVESPVFMKTFSSAVIGPGFSWKRCFVNRHVDKTYHCDDPGADMKEWLMENGMNLEDTVGMMTAARLKDVARQVRRGDGFAVSAIVTAGVSNAVDAAQAEAHSANQYSVGTINGWIFVDGTLPEEAFVQAIMTATEAKVKAMHDMEVKDPVTGTIATGTSTDSLLVAAAQRGTTLAYAGTGTALGRAIGKAVYDCTIEAIENYQRARAEK
jgi:iron complex transport system ATP-binding protein